MQKPVYKIGYVTNSKLKTHDFVTEAFIIFLSWIKLNQGNSCTDKLKYQDIQFRIDKKSDYIA